MQGNKKPPSKPKKKKPPVKTKIGEFYCNGQVGLLITPNTSIAGRLATKKEGRARDSRSQTPPPRPQQTPCTPAGLARLSTVLSRKESKSFPLADAAEYCTLSLSLPWPWSSRRPEGTSLKFSSSIAAKGGGRVQSRSRGGEREILWRPSENVCESKKVKSYAMPQEVLRGKLKRTRACL